MRIRLSQLRRIIKEEVTKLVTESESSIVRRGDTLFIVDDEGNREEYGPVEGSDYEYLMDGEGAPLERGAGGGSYNAYGYSGAGASRSSRRRW